MKSFLSLLLVSTCLLIGNSYARDYKKDEVIRQGMGTMGLDKNAAVKELVESCLAQPFIEHDLAEFVGLSGVSFSNVNDQVMAYGMCNYKIKSDMKQME